MNPENNYSGIERPKGCDIEINKIGFKVYKTKRNMLLPAGEHSKIIKNCAQYSNTNRPNSVIGNCS